MLSLPTGDDRDCSATAKIPLFGTFAIHSDVLGDDDTKVRPCKEVLAKKTSKDMLDGNFSPGG